MIKTFEQFEEELSKRQIEEAKERIADQFWIDRNGNEYHWEGSLENAWNLISLHAEIAYELLKGKNLRDPEDFLMKQGWILVGSTVYSSPIINKKPSQAQVDKLFDLGLYSKLLILHNNMYPRYDDVKKYYEDYD